MLHRWRFWLVPLGLAILALLTGGGLGDRPAQARPAPAAPVGVPGCWATTDTAPQEDEELYAVAALAPNDVWAVGRWFGNGQWPLVLHWDGQQWNHGPGVVSGGHPAQLNGVSGTGPNDVWVVGSDFVGSGPLRPLLSHWDGADWTNVAVPTPITPTVLYGVSARTPTDAWAVGDVIKHWNGAAWSDVPAPPGGPLRAVAALAANNAWAVGSYDNGGVQATRIVHWDGTAWTVVPSPNAGPGDNILYGITAVAANDLWAVGSADTGSGARTLILHWDGATWTAAAHPGPSATSHLYAVTAAAANDVWAVGDYYGLSDFQTLTLHWDGAAWSVVASPNQGWEDNKLYGVAALGPGAIWAVGYEAWDESTQYTTGLAFHYTRSCTPPPPPTCTVAWPIVPSPSFEERSTQLRAVAPLTANDIWAVGDGDPTGTSPAVTLIEHWNGAAWTVAPSPNNGAGDNRLRGVQAFSATNAWAVGNYTDAGVSEPLTLHWDGTAWATIPSFVTGPHGAALYGIGGIAPNDIWAGGYITTTVGGDEQPLLLHWNGTAWSNAPLPSGLVLPAVVYAIKAFAANDVWAVGGSTAWYNGQTFILHWDGAAWSVVPQPSRFGAYTAVDGSAPNDIWTVGFSTSPPLLAHWDGTAWSQVQGPHDAVRNVYGVAARAANDVWVVGTGGVGRYYTTWVYHWDGVAWTRVSSGRPAQTNNVLFSVAALAPQDAWAVGIGDADTLVEHYTGPCILLSPTPTATPPAAPTTTATLPASPTRPAAPSATNTPPGATATPTLPPASPSATPCTLTFTDVDQNHPFYPYIRCLACRGIVAGYADGTFRPGNAVTRGQLAKILAGAAAFADAIPSTQQTFADVPYGAAFWRWTEQLAVHQAISGYACGGPGEPCDGQHRPYYRPGSPATRGQIAKITALAADLRDPVPSGQQTFADVPGSNPFRLWIEQLAGRGIVSGYSCGGPGEPCDPAQRPYFRWGADTTRGQMTKITANTFFPACPTPTER